MSDVSATMDLRRRDAADKLRGRTRYTIDRYLPGMLHAAVLRAGVPSGRIIRLDTSRAARMPGVRAIVTASDAPGMIGIGIADHPLFARDIIRYDGEPLAAVAAVTLAQAQAALAAIDVEIEPLPAVLTMAEALAPGARLVHPDWRSYEVLVEGGARAGNVAWEATVVRGDVDAAFARPDVEIVESLYRVGRQNHVAFEPRAVVASYEDGRFHIETSTQVPWSIRNATARVLGVPASQVRVTVPPVGGGFGLKFDLAVEPFAALLARASGRPVRLVNSREDEMLTCLFRENADIRIRSAVTREGEIVGREAVVLMDCGAYGGEQIFLTTMTAHTLGGNYRLGSVRMVSRAVYTNTAPNGAFRCCNGVYNTFALERHTDEIAARIGMDPLAFRRRNVLGDKDLGATGQVFEGDVLGPMLDRMDTLRDAAAPLPARTDGKLLGRATTVGTWFVFVGPSAATVNMNADGTATLVTSGVEIGSGSMMQSLPQIVASTLGIAPEQVIVRAADTDAAGYDVGVGGGRTTVSLGAASLSAAQEVRTKLLRIASEMIEAAPGDLVMRDGRIEIAGAPGSGRTVAEVATRAQALGGPVAGTGAFTGAGVPAMPGCVAGHFIDAIDIPVFAVHDCEVAVDPETGHVEVLSYRVVQDVGRALNPRAIHGQIQGGVVQGLGYALHEEVTIGGNGRVSQSGFETYRVPLALDVVPVEISLYEGAPSVGPLGTKGAGEVPILNVGAAVACAVANATGKRVQELPLTPPRVLELLLERKPDLALSHIAEVWADNLVRPHGAR
ncbi:MULTISPECIES: xanthine dehydrogenase family protein molybdopterin-binding subunit [Bradyrhizobium]|jgi:CO/xanthine dehydrogenase Mo-binding subunit|uniref:xanthine dehydrogenase family protein molybdopterin-binding subunit n=1 Tax=Bradyrhizobium TaxID=374 RepID=UPI000486B22C|nr:MULTISPECIES: xanthine dehydrogenase family protein molybdopterin-binding subunit [Bradyrhizobium]MCS3448383.1 CO/xanthine dehydrogenase Mo-binding subunit [Bradyrhizobium elkanii]MCS3560478.1 CO/xanthine dehydrogenase Mo-binding subunit [Bradyrhizobium elkanii]MCW2149679.1 CO/xanthine dehydrogenase Mo-binding subunit [Bradyrhizobium elkanii]MCW2360354.1 CO/xanthine dehydrogenase Mo-binding subunit [Bradyrhizobium elkanii]MCW2373408.1 CO/xanthine dehydrogenase Mo-binding subunit [Bradyrhizo